MSLPEPLITVVIPAYNYAATLARAVASVLPQLDDGPAELIVIDDGSTDATPQVIDALCKAHPGRFRAIRKENGGLSSVRNRGIREARGGYLVFLDADDEMLPGALAAFAAHVGAHPETRLVVGGHDAIEAGGRRRMHLPAELPADPFGRVKGYLLDKHISLTNGACAMHKQVFERGAYPEHFRSAEDIPVFTQVLAHYPCTVLARPQALIYKHDDSLRHQFSHAKAGGLALVDEVFSPQRLGAGFEALRPAYYVQRCLSLFRSAYLAGDAAAAREYFRRALAQDWRVLFKTAYSRKALRLWLRGRA
ncbi:glycosyltransferase family 2 protein [Thauera linaloolentis]|uniref:Glycosyl transferase n=1 Tax=Thauera linaloolentis (strain DSM 12138 / JCM 21573 / CCUG 41526 / CIP 105981 / IAM 15112 / NBRC 102519 / 47Lol) TaxID=1123367 RepID=N6ZCN3_THAL4|nr:glycosyltransferase family 2 protein [Thauera linaloolentis]ENO89914.1 glycosyl transferase [Thauera linaloolentis 47Lol = DSM 12138]MCM8564536.1 glycosyltransferase family 2 protein [Thauera linaloolentis]